MLARQTNDESERDMDTRQFVNHMLNASILALLVFACRNLPLRHSDRSSVRLLDGHSGLLIAHGLGSDFLPPPHTSSEFEFWLSKFRPSRNLHNETTSTHLRNEHRIELNLHSK